MSVLVLCSNDADLGLVPTALALAKQLATDCSVLSATPAPTAQPLLERARGLGVRRGCNVWADVLATCDFLAVARVLTAAIGNLGAAPQLVLTGHGQRGAVPAAVADLLSCPYLGSVTDVGVDGDTLLVSRHAGRAVGHYRRSGACVLGLLAERTTTPSPPEREVTGEIVHWSLSDIGLSEPEISYRKRFLPQPAEHAPFAPVKLSLVELRQRLAAEGLAIEGA